MEEANRRQCMNDDASLRILMEEFMLMLQMLNLSERISDTAHGDETDSDTSLDTHKYSLDDGCTFIWMLLHWRLL